MLPGVFCQERLPQKFPRLQPLVQKWVVDLLNPTFHRGSRILREAGQMLTYPFRGKHFILDLFPRVACGNCPNALVSLCCMTLVSAGAGAPGDDDWMRGGTPVAARSQQGIVSASSARFSCGGHRHIHSRCSCSRLRKCSKLEAPVVSVMVVQSCRVRKDALSDRGICMH